MSEKKFPWTQINRIKGKKKKKKNPPRKPTNSAE